MAARIVIEQRGEVVVETSAPVTLGRRAGNDVVLDDPIVADRHCEFTCGEGFRVRDLGSATGTWVAGRRAASPTEITDGAEIVVGASRIAARIEQRDGSPTLVLDVQAQAFFWKKPGKGAFDNDPDQLVRSEVRFGRFAALSASNRFAAVLAVTTLLAATFVGAVMEPLADAGPLLPQHALVAATGAAPAGAPPHFANCVKLAGEQGCNVCHDGGTTPASKCLQCHGDLADAATRRHPYTKDGVLAPLPGVAVDEQVCIVCHRDHQGPGFLKPASDQLLGQCATCHGEAAAAFTPERFATDLRVQLPPERQRSFSTIRFPHDAHLAKNIDCTICHRPDPALLADRAAGVPDDPDRRDFGETPYEVCASCHVPGARAERMSAEQQQTWLAKDHQWPVLWHGTDEGGQKCARCHAEVERGGKGRFGPELRHVEHGRFTAAQHAAERARYTSPTRLHKDEFTKHANGKACTSCHLRGDVAAAAATSPRAFWHALHLADGSLLPSSGRGGAVSTDAAAGCISCHTDLKTATALRPVDGDGYRWPADPAAQAACAVCHREGEGQPLLLTAATSPIPADRRAQVPDFPHDVHVASKAFGAAGTVLAEGCFACHEFERPDGGGEYAFVPRTKAAAADCSSCHGGHEHVGGGSCEECHPPEKGRSNSFVTVAAVMPGETIGAFTVPPAAERRWPGATGFSHLSRGHSGPDLECKACHALPGVAQAKTLADVVIPDENAPACRDCHLKQQFHWR